MTAVALKNARAAQDRAERLKQRNLITDLIADAMYRHCPSWSVDELLLHPRVVIQLFSVILRKQLHRQATDANIDELCRIALAARKRGDLRLGGRPKAGNSQLATNH